LENKKREKRSNIDGKKEEEIRGKRLKNHKEMEKEVKISME
jgi:hypothetical protein